MDHVGTAGMLGGLITRWTVRVPGGLAGLADEGRDR
jgi:hypothetical protein